MGPQRFGRRLVERAGAAWFERTVARLYRKYRAFTMVPRSSFGDSLRLCRNLRASPGCVVECGVWRGGMSAAMAEVLGPGRAYYLFDSFQGLPPAQPIDGPHALAWQANPNGAYYYDNCKADSGFAEEAMKCSGASSYKLVKGWFKATLPGFVPPEPILVLRLDADWYDSTRDCLSHLYPYVRVGGVIIIDDYYVWDGCARAVHEFLSSHALTERIRQTRRGVAYIRKQAASS
jgi:O-methyltransferase